MPGATAVGQCHADHALILGGGRARWQSLATRRKTTLGRHDPRLGIGSVACFGADVGGSGRVCVCICVCVTRLESQKDLTKGSSPTREVPVWGNWLARVPSPGGRWHGSGPVCDAGRVGRRIIHCRKGTRIRGMIAYRKLAGGRAGRGEWDPDQGSELVKIAIAAGRPAKKDKGRGRGSIDGQRAGGGRPRSPASPNANLTPVPVPRVCQCRCRCR